MRRFAAIVAVTVVICVSVFAQQQGGGRRGGGAPAQPPTDPTVATLFKAADLNAALAKLGTERPNASVRVFSIAPYTINVEHRAPVAQAPSVHADEHELFYVVEGSATMMTGGKITEGNKGMEGGTAHNLAKGDFLMVPKGVTHWFSKVDPPVLNIMSFHLPAGN
jgi:mannose-6-phosphate isomerase-like protein (cupin superfamily)